MLVSEEPLNHSLRGIFMNAHLQLLHWLYEMIYHYGLEFTD